MTPMLLSLVLVLLLDGHGIAARTG